VKGNASVALNAIITEHTLPARVQEAHGERMGVTQESLLALSVGAPPLWVLAEMTEQEGQ